MSSIFELSVVTKVAYGASNTNKIQELFIKTEKRNEN